jgi:predicted permease
MPDSFRQDFRYAFRNLGRSPLFTCAAVLTLALGIGANTAIFSLIDETLFRPLDFPQAEQLADVFAFNKSSQTFLSSSYPDYEDFRARTQTFQRVSAFVRMPLNVSWGRRNERLPVEAVSGNFFAMLELPPAAGRTFRDDDDSPASGRVAMVSEEIGGADLVGAQMVIEDEPFTIIGVVPKRYHGTNLNWGDPPRVWIPLQSTAIVRPRFRSLDLFHQRAMQWLLITGRLRQGIDVEKAQAEMQTIAAGISLSSPATNRDITATVFTASRAKFWPAYRASITRSLQVFAIAAGMVLLLTCANLSNLLLSRAVGRRREFAIRLSLGAGRARLVRQLSTESLLLALPGCAASLGIAYGLGRVFVHFPNALGLPLALDAGVENRVLFFCLALSIMATVLFGLAPALEATRTAVLPALKESGNTVSGGGSDWLRNSLLVLQVAFSMVLLVGGGLFARSVIRGWSVDPGFRADGLLTAGFSSPTPGAQSAGRLRRAQQELLERLRRTPGVLSATLASAPPSNQMHFRTQVKAPGAETTVDRLTVGTEFFRTMGMALVSGREFGQADGETAPRVAIVNRRTAAGLWPGENPLGRSITVQNTTMLIVGVVHDSRYGSPWEESQPYLYVADTQSGSPASYLILRTGGRPDDFASTVSKEWNEILPQSPLYEFRTADDLLKVALAPQRMAAGIFGAFGLLAVILASVGLYSVMAYTVARRTREIGIRLAIGAKPAMVVRQILGKSMAVTGVGVALGALFGALLARLVAPQVKGVSVYDGATFALVVALLGLVAFLAAMVPARRAARIDPQAALRSE